MTQDWHLPLIALQYSVVSFELEMNPFKDLYTIRDVNNGNINSDTNVDTSFGKNKTFNKFNLRNE